MRRRATADRRSGIVLLLCQLTLVACQSAPPEEARYRVVPQVAPLQPRRVAFSPTDAAHVLVVEASGLIGLWHVAQPTQPTLLASTAAGALDARFSPDGDVLYVVARDGHLSAWSLDGERLWKSAAGHAGAARTITVGEQFIATGGDDGVIRLWTGTGEPAGEPLRGHAGIVLSLDVAADGALLSAAADGSIRVWRRTSSGAYAATVLFQDPTAAASPGGRDAPWGWEHAVAFSPNATVLAGAGRDGSLRLWDAHGTPRGEPTQARDGQPVRVVAVAPNGQFLVSGGVDGTTRLRNLDGTARGRPIAAHQGAVWSVAIAPDSSRFVTAGADDRLRLWHLDGTKLAELPATRAPRIRAVALSERHSVLALGDAAGTISVWNLDGSARGRATGHRGAVNALAFAARGDLLASAGQDATVRLWNLDGTPHGAPIAGHTGEVIALAFAPAGESMATAGGDGLSLRDAGGNDRGVRFAGLRGAADGLAFSPQGDVLAGADRTGHFRLWRLDGTPDTRAIEGHDGAIHALAFSPDGSQLGSAGHDGTVRVWSREGGMIAELSPRRHSPVRSVTFAPDGTALAAGGDDGLLRVWSRPAHGLEVIDLGAPIDQVGYFAGAVWARINGDRLVFLDRARGRRVTFLLRSEGLLAFTDDGWFAGSDRAERSVRVFGPSGAPLEPHAVLLRKVPEQIVAAIGG